MIEYKKVRVNIENYERKADYKRFVPMDQPCVNMTAKVNITNLVNKKGKHKLNAMLCFCIAKAAQRINEFHYALEDGGLNYYDYVCTNAVVKGKDNKLYYAEYKYLETLDEFEEEYDKINNYCYENCTIYEVHPGALFSTSAITGYPFESISVPYLPDFKYTFATWGAYEKIGDECILHFSIRFHHALFDGEHIALFYKNFQEEINRI